MNKKPIIGALVFTAILISLSIASAYDGYYYPSDNIPQRTTYISDKQSYTNYYSWGTEKVSTTTRTTKTTQGYYPNSYYQSYPSYNYNSYYRPSQYAPTQIYRAPSYSNWRYKEPYNRCNYNPCNSYNTYTTPYYYQPRYDSNLGYYNWQY